MSAGFTLSDVHSMTLAQMEAFGAAAERRRRLARTELLVMLRAARYTGKKGGPNPYEQLLKASRTATWLTPG